MAIEPGLVSVNLKSKQKEIKKDILVECPLDVLSEDMGSVLNAYSYAYVENTEKKENKIIFNGKAIFSVCYEKNGEYKKCECAKGFSFEEETLNDVEILPKVYFDSTKVDLSSTYALLKLPVTVTASLFEVKEESVIAEGEGFYLKKETVNTCTGLGIKSGTYPVEDEWETNSVISEVAFHRAESVITAVQCGVGCIIVDGEVYLSYLLLQNGDKKGIIKENRVLPYRIEIESEECMPSLYADAEVCVKSVKTDITVDEEKSKSNIESTVNLTFYAEGYEEKEIEVGLDAFSLTNELSFERKEIGYTLPPKRCVEKKEVTLRVPIEELSLSKKIIGVLCEKFEITETSLNNGLNVTGVYTAKVYVADEDDKISVIDIYTPLETNLDYKQTCSDISISAVVINSSAKIITLTELEIQTALVFGIVEKDGKSFNCIKNVTEGDEKPSNDYAISVYIAKSGEDLWSLSKRLNVCPEELVLVNADLQFPLTGEERIVIYRQK